jgi:hypothetical protein
MAVPMRCRLRAFRAGDVEEDVRAAHRTIATRFSIMRINQAEGSVMAR